jgi:hypothetical protein
MGLEDKITSADQLVAADKNAVGHLYSDRRNWRTVREQLRETASMIIPLDLGGAAVHTGIRWPAVEGHLSLCEEPNGKMSFYPSEEYADNDRRIVMTPGRYLTKYSPLAPGEIAKLAGYFKDVKFDIALTGEEIERVYRNGPHSCAKFETWPRDQLHPGHALEGEFGLAYTQHEDKYSARAVCWMKEMNYYSVYGSTARLESNLKKRGFVRAKKSLNGAKLKKIPHHSIPGAFLCPPVDGLSRVRIMEDHLVVADVGLSPYGVGTALGYVKGTP